MPSPTRTRLSALLLVTGVCLRMAPEAAAALPSLPNQPITPIPAPAATDPQLVELGRLLFNSPDLSGNGARSCASCHDVATNGASPHRFDWAPDGRPLTINTPTVFNAALSWRLGWRGQDRTVRAQADDSLHDPTLMDADPATVVARLHRSTALQGPFRLAGRTPSWSAVLDALAAYETTLLTPDSPFDRWLKGDHAALTPRQVSGYETFKSIGCASCHQGVNVGGNLFEHQGVVNPAGTPSRALFRVPSLRNVALTAPYFHDGSAATLHDAVRRMANAQLGRDLDDGMIDNIAAFLTALTGAHPAPPPAARP